MTEPIDWDAMIGARLPEESPEDLCDHWRNLAMQEHAEVEKLRWMLAEILRVGTSYPKVMKEKLETQWEERGKPSKGWPFR